MTTPVAERVLEALGEAFRVLAGGDLELLVNALTEPLDDTYQLTRRTDRGWAAAFDLDETPDPAWLGRAIGSDIPPGLTKDEIRTYVRTRAYHRRGTPEAIKAAVRTLLTGTKTVWLEERDGSPWRLTIHVFSGEMAPGVTLDDIKAAATLMKPVGIILEALNDGPIYNHFRPVHGPTYDDVAADFATYDDAITHVPE